jgi:hypothetical protein
MINKILVKFIYNLSILFKFIVFLYLFSIFYSLKLRSIPFVWFLILVQCFVGKSDIHIFKIDTTIKIKVINKWRSFENVWQHDDTSVKNLLIAIVRTMRDMESWAVCYCHFKKCQCKCTVTVIMIDIFKKTVKLT